MGDDEPIEDEEEYSYEWLPSHVTADALFFAATIAQASADHLMLIAQRAAASHNKVVNQNLFAVEAAKELETIIEPKE